MGFYLFSVNNLLERLSLWKIDALIVSLSAADAEKCAFEHKPGSAENMGAFTLPANCDEMDYSATRAYFSMPRILPLIQA